MKFATTSLAALIALLLLPASTSARSWQHADLETSPPRTVAILPPLASITRGHVNEAEPMIKETQALESAVAAHAVEFLTKLGYTVDRHALSTDACSSDRELQAAVVQVQSRVDELLPTMSEKPKSIREGRYSIGETAVPVATASKADALIALRASAVVPSKGARALTGVLSGIFNLIPMVPTTHTELIAVVIDGKTGLVEGLFVGVEGGPVLKDPDRVGTRVVDEAFMDYPRPGGTTSRRKSRQVAKAEPAKVPPPSTANKQDEEDIVARFEKAYEITAPPGPPAEEVRPVPGWTQGGPVAVGEAAQEATTEPPRVPVATTTTPAATSAAPAAIDPAVRALFEAPAAQRPRPTAQAVIQVLSGGPGIAVRNTTRSTLRASVDLAAWRTLSPGGQFLSDVRAGSHRILVSDESGREVMRADVMVSAQDLTSVEIWPVK